MVEFMNMVAAASGHGIGTKSSYKQLDGQAVVQYNCDRGGIYRNRHGRLDKTRATKAKSIAHYYVVLW